MNHCVQWSAYKELCASECIIIGIIELELPYHVDAKRHDYTGSCTLCTNSVLCIMRFGTVE